MNTAWFDRVIEHDVIRTGFAEIFGVLDGEAKVIL